MIRPIIATCLLLSLLLLPGCGGKTQKSEKSSKTVSQKTPPADPLASKTTPPIPPKEPTAKEPESAGELQQLAASIKRDGDGKIVEVSFRGKEITEADLVHLTELTALRSVLLNDTEITDEGFKTLGQIESLQNIDARGCGIGNAGLKHIEGLKNLKALRLSGENGKATVDDDGLDSLAKLPKLKALFLDHLWISVDGLGKLKGLKDLQEVYLAKTSVDDDAIAVLAEFPALRKLRVSNTHVSDAGLEKLSSISKLVELDLSECSNLSNAGMPHLAALKQLAKLNLWRVDINDEGVEPLAALTNLQWLNLDNTKTSDAGLPALKDMQKLTFLHLGSTLVTDAGLPELKPLKALKDLKVTRTAVTADAVAELKKSLPDCEIQLKYIEGE